MTLKENYAWHVMITNTEIGNGEQFNTKENIENSQRKLTEIRTELVEKYKQLIKSGEYRMEPEELASRMVEDSFSESILRSKT